MDPMCRKGKIMIFVGENVIIIGLFHGLTPNTGREQCSRRWGALASVEDRVPAFG